jgi:5-methylcytosine-specific restriction endonuclease McrA
MTVPRPCLACGVPTTEGSYHKACKPYSWTHKAGHLGGEWTPIRDKVLAEEPNCRICGAKAITVDHILARAFGGTHERTNLQPLCRQHAKEKDTADSLEGKRRAKPSYPRTV